MTLHGFQGINAYGNIGRSFRRPVPGLLLRNIKSPAPTNSSVAIPKAAVDKASKRQAFAASRSLLYSVVLLSVSIMVSSCGSTQRLLEPEPDWVFLAQGKASHLRENDVFKIKSKDKFSALKLFVYDRSISIKQLKITLINGDVLTPALDAHINAGDRSRPIELSSDGRQIEKITIRYKSEGKLFSDKAVVQIGGLRPQDVRN